ncbi:MAG: ribonuclease H-like domain-containing protein [Spirochaetia bacterium]|nr:ribonuclease H-like domain-containing protein [Spirochaetia bacterium]
MLQNTFCHLPGIGLKREERIWHQGITSWEVLLSLSKWENENDSLLKSISFDHIYSLIEDTKRKFENRDLLFFQTRLPANETWRLYSFPGIKSACLDIETTGLGRDASITTIALYAEGKIQVFVNGKNLDQFSDEISRYDLLITYNGKAFDLPFITRELGVQFHQAHIDLRFLLADLGYRGGLKGCEKSLGITREGLEDLDGFHAVLLWKEYLQSKNQYFLETLLAYNIADTVNLEKLLVKAVNLKISKLKFLKIPFKEQTELPESYYRADPEVIRHIKKLRPGIN